MELSSEEAQKTRVYEYTVQLHRRSKKRICLIGFRNRRSDVSASLHSTPYTRSITFHTTAERPQMKIFVEAVHGQKLSQNINDSMLLLAILLGASPIYSSTTEKLLNAAISTPICTILVHDHQRSTARFSTAWLRPSLLDLSLPWGLPAYRRIAWRTDPAKDHHHSGPARVRVVHPPPPTLLHTILAFGKDYVFPTTDGEKPDRPVKGRRTNSGALEET